MDNKENTLASQSQAAQPSNLPRLPTPHEELRARWKCEDCNGTGEVGELIDQGYFQPPERARCSNCDGTGQVSIEAYTDDQMADYARTAVSALAGQSQATKVQAVPEGWRIEKSDDTFLGTAIRVSNRAEGFATLRPNSDDPRESVLFRYFDQIIAAPTAQEVTQQAAPTVRAEVVERFADYSKIAHLIGSIYFAGDFKAETYNERELEARLVKTGHRYASWEEIENFRADDLPVEFLTQQAAPDMRDAYVGAREDLAIWKKRALEAEESCRRLTAVLNSENGPTLMGEPVVTQQAAKAETAEQADEQVPGIAYPTTHADLARISHNTLFTRWVGDRSEAAISPREAFIAARQLPRAPTTSTATASGSAQIDAKAILDIADELELEASSYEGDFADTVNGCADALRHLAATSASAQASQAAASEAVRDVLAERQRQIEVEGWTPEHDDKYINCELARAAATYATCSHIEQLKLCGEQVWPWHPDWWKRSTYRRDLTKAGALILAEIERLDRDALRTNPATPASKGDAS